MPTRSERIPATHWSGESLAPASTLSLPALWSGPTALAGRAFCGRRGRISRWFPSTATSTPGCCGSTGVRLVPWCSRRRDSTGSQARRADAALLEVLGRLDAPAVRVAVEAERAVLEATGGTCRAPVGALGTVAGGRFSLLVAGVNSDGSDRRVETVEGTVADAGALAREAGRRLAAEVALR